MKILLDALCAIGFKRILDVIIDLIKMEVTLSYLQVLERLRGAFILLMLSVLSLALISIGFIAIHVALFIFLPWEIETKAGVLLALGALYILAPSIFILKLSSRRRWLRFSQAEELINLWNKRG